MKMPVASIVRSPGPGDQPTAERADDQAHQGEHRDHRADLGVADPEAAGEHRQHRHQHPEADRDAEGDQPEDEHVTGQGGTVAQPTADRCGLATAPVCRTVRGPEGYGATPIPLSTSLGQRREEEDRVELAKKIGRGCAPGRRRRAADREHGAPTDGCRRGAAAPSGRRAAAWPVLRAPDRRRRRRGPTVTSTRRRVRPGRARAGSRSPPPGPGGSLVVALITSSAGSSASCPRSSSRWPSPSCWPRC